MGVGFKCCAALWSKTPSTRYSLSGEISNVNEGVVEGGEDVRHTENLLVFENVLQNRNAQGAAGRVSTWTGRPQATHCRTTVAYCHLKLWVWHARVELRCGYISPSLLPWGRGLRRPQRALVLLLLLLLWMP